MTPRTAALALALLCCPTPAHAQDPITTGAVTLLSAPPPSLAGNQTTSNTQIHLFAERLDEVLGGAVSADIVPTGVDATYDSFGTLPGGSLPVNSRVNSYLLHQDSQKGVITLSGTVEFPTDIVGVIVRSSSLNDSDPLLKAPATTYPMNNSGRGLEQAGVDEIEVFGDRRRIRVRLETSNAGATMDQIRVLTAAAPPIFRSFCSGQAGCPCQNSHGSTSLLMGCENSALLGGLLLPAGNASVASTDDVSMTLGGLPRYTFGMMFVGTAETQPLPFGDGLLCVTPGPPGPAGAPWNFGLRRFPGRLSDAAGLVHYPGVKTYLGAQGLALAAGQKLYFQGFYRNPGLATCAVPAGFNLTNGVEVTFQP